jgi:restriction system protein
MTTEKKIKLTLEQLKASTSHFVGYLNLHPIKELYGVTDGKAVGTYVEHQIHSYLQKKFNYDVGSSASGIDFPQLGVDLKVTSVRQPQSSCPYRDASQKIYGLGYHLIVLVYQKSDNRKKKAAILRFAHAIFVDKKQTADYQTTLGLNEIIRRNGNRDDLIAYLEERNLPLDEIGREKLAKMILQNPPRQGYLTISNALQWRLQYSRIISVASQGADHGVKQLIITDGGK